MVLWESPEEEGNWGYGAGKARPIPPYLSIHHGNSQRAEKISESDVVDSLILE